MPSSVAAACSSKLKPWQNFLRSARPQARLMRLPNGACSTSCMPPDSSKKRSSATVSVVGTVPRLRFASARYVAICSAALWLNKYSVSRRSMAGASSPSFRGSSGPGQLEIDRRPKLRDRHAHFLAARRRFAEPERHRRRLALGVGDAHRAVADAQDAPGGIAELEHVTRQRLDGEVLVQRADEMAFGLEQHAEVEHFRDCAAVDDRVQAGAFPASELLVQTVVVNQRGAAAAARRVPAGEHLDDLIELFFLEVAIRIGAFAEVEQRLLVPFLLRRGLGDDLLGKDVERLVRHRDAVELAVMDSAHHRGAFDQVVARQGEDPPFRHALDGVAGTADALQEGGDAVRRRDLADQVDVADVDAKLERRGGDEDLQLPLAQLFFSLQPRLLRQAAVVRGDVVGAEPLGQLVRHTLGQAARVYRDQRGAMRLHQRDQPVVDFLPDLVRHHRFERRVRHFHRQVHLPSMALVHH